jgi:CDP-paratose 2-epimerase
MALAAGSFAGLAAQGTVKTMQLLITGGCGFVGSRVGLALRRSFPDWTITSLDNFSRTGSRRNTSLLVAAGIGVIEADLRDRDFAKLLPRCDWVIDCAANPSVLAGVTGNSTSLDVMDHNLIGTIHLLEYCKAVQAGLILVSTSRVYSASALSRMPIELVDDAYRPGGWLGSNPHDWQSPWFGFSDRGLSERFSTAAPLSLYGASKLASELVATEYAAAFGFPLFINRCGLMAGAGQFGKPDQGIVGYWIHSWWEGKPLRYVGFDGKGHQVRDCLHPEDLAGLLESQIRSGAGFDGPRLCNVSGGLASQFSLSELSSWCARRWPERRPASYPIPSDFSSRPYDAPWIVLDSGLAETTWHWRPAWSKEQIWEEIARHAEENPHWLSGCE